MAEHNEIGKIGENVATTFLVKHGFSVVERNYMTHYGEIDIVAEAKGVLRFVEVKSIKVRDFSNLSKLKIRPEDNLTREKWRKLITSIKTYLNHKNIENTQKWQVDLACVYINTETREGLVKLLENVHIE